MLSMLVVAVSLACAGQERAAAPAPRPRADLQKFEPLRRSIVAVHALAAAPLRPTRSAFSGLVDAAVTELRLADNRINTDDERHAVALFRPVVQAYADANFVWDRVRYRPTSTSRDIILYDVRHPPAAGIRDLVDLAQRNHLPVTESMVLDYRGSTYQTIPGDSVLRILRIAADKFAEANSAFEDLSRAR